ncbi:MAG: hypothetical protein R6V56_04975 [Lentisphaeria bacterium]
MQFGHEKLDVYRLARRSHELREESAVYCDNDNDNENDNDNDDQYGLRSHA